MISMNRIDIVITDLLGHYLIVSVLSDRDVYTVPNQGSPLGIIFSSSITPSLNSYLVCVSPEDLVSTGPLSLERVRVVYGHGA